MERIPRLQLIRFLVAVDHNDLAYVAVHVGQVFDVSVIQEFGALSVQLEIRDLILAGRVQTVRDGSARQVGLFGEEDQLELRVLHLGEEVVEAGPFFVAPARAKRPLGMQKDPGELDNERVRRLIIRQLYGLGQQLFCGRIFYRLCFLFYLNSHIKKTLVFFGKVN